MKNDKIKQYEAFENFVEMLFSNSGYEVKRRIKINIECSKKIVADLIANGKGNKFLIEVKYSTPRKLSSVESLRRVLTMVSKAADYNDMIPVLVVPSVVSDEFRREIKEFNDKFIVLDAANLLAITGNNQIYRDEFSSLTQYVLFDIEPLEPEIVFSLKNDADCSDELLREFIKCKTGENYGEFESLCEKMLRFVFSDNLTLWNTQKRSNDGLYRFDLLCRVKSGEQHEFWEIMERYFNSKYIIFEFKNYKEEITQQEIYTTEKYLYHKALRSVAIVIAASGYDKNSQWAAKGCLRENGKLIILLDKNDLIKMYSFKKKQEDPSQCLLEKLDELLSELEK